MCTNGSYQSDGRHKNYICSKTQCGCGFVRWCINDNCFKMIDGWQNCNMNK